MLSNPEIIETARRQMPDAFTNRDALIGDSFGSRCVRVPIRNMRGWPGYDSGTECLLVDADGRPTDFALDVRAMVSSNFEDDPCRPPSESIRPGSGTLDGTGLVDGIADLLHHAGGLDFPGMPLATDCQSLCASPQSLGFYLPFHHFTSKHWGIHLTLEGVCRIAWWLRHLSERKLMWCQCVEAARIFLLAHMRAHHNIEMFALRLEIAHAGRPVYENGFNRHHLRTSGTAMGVQETYANAYAIRRYRSSNRCFGRGLHLMTETLKALLGRFPVGWRGGAEHLTEKPFMDLCTELKHDLHFEAFPENACLDKSLWHGGFMPLDGLPDIKSRVHYLVPRALLAARPAY